MAHSDSDATTADESTADDEVLVPGVPLATVLAAARQQRDEVLQADGEGSYTRELKTAINQVELVLARSDDRHDWTRLERMMVGRYESDPDGEVYFPSGITGEAMLYGETVYFGARLFQTGDDNCLRFLAVATDREAVEMEVDVGHPDVVVGKAELDNNRRGDDVREGDAVLLRQPRPVGVTLTE